MTPKILNSLQADFILDGLWVSAWIWLPLVYGAYVLGKRRASVFSLLLFVTAECAALAGAGWYMDARWTKLLWG